MSSKEGGLQLATSQRWSGTTLANFISSARVLLAVPYKHTSKCASIICIDSSEYISACAMSEDVRAISSDEFKGN